MASKMELSLNSDNVVKLFSNNDDNSNEETSSWSQEKVNRNKSVSKNQKRFPNFLIETILKIIPEQGMPKNQDQNSKNNNLKKQKEVQNSGLNISPQRIYPNKTFSMIQEPQFNVVRDSDRYRSALQNFTHQLQNWSNFVQMSYGRFPIPQSKYIQPFLYGRPHMHNQRYLAPQTSPKRKVVWNPLFSQNISPKNEAFSDLKNPQVDSNPLKKLNQLSQNLSQNNTTPPRRQFKLRHSFDDVTETSEPKISKVETEKSSEGTTSPGNKTEKPEGQIWPAWVYCTRYSDRPSAGPRIRRNKRKSPEGKSPDSDVTDKRARTAFSESQLEFLQKEFEQSQYLTEERRIRLAKNLGLKVAQIKVWFQNKRAKVKKMSGVRNGLAMELIAQGLYNHCTQDDADQEK